MDPGPVPLRAAALPTGHQMSVQTVCLGWHWQPYQYIRTASDVNGAQVLGYPKSRSTPRWRRP
jgi:alkylated DNA repair protein (DNA oxidative demethylase)